MLIVVVVVVSAVNNKISLARSRVTNFEIGRRAALSMQNVYHLNLESSPLHVLVCIRYPYPNSFFFGNHYRRVISTSMRILDHRLKNECIDKNCSDAAK